MFNKTYLKGVCYSILSTVLRSGKWCKLVNTLWHTGTREHAATVGKYSEAPKAFTSWKGVLNATSGRNRDVRMTQACLAQGTLSGQPLRGPSCPPGIVTSRLSLHRQTYVTKIITTTKCLSASCAKEAVPLLEKQAVIFPQKVMNRIRTRVRGGRHPPEAQN